MADLVDRVQDRVARDIKEANVGVHPPITAYGKDL
jgi:hypothetical protein